MKKLCALLLCLSPALFAEGPPAAGEAAPKVSAKKHGSEEVVDLSKVDKITVLVFGSHT